MEGLSCNYRSPLSWAQGKSSRLRDLRFLYQGIIYFCSRNGRLQRHPGVEKLEVMLVNTDLVSNSQRKTKFIWCARKIRTLLGRFARARKFLDRGTPGLRSKFESQSARMPNIRKASPECSKAQSLLHFKAKFSFQHPISHLFHTSTGPLSPGLRLFLRLLSRSRFRPSRGRAGVSLGLDGWL